MTRILVIDDRPINRQFLTTLLRYRHFETREAGDGAEGLNVAREWKPDLAIVDIVMPGMDGVEFVRHVRADPELAKTPIIFYTASYEASEAARLAPESGIAHILMKPSEPEVILDTVDKALGQSVERPLAEMAETAAAEFLRMHSEASLGTALIEFQLEIAAQRRKDDVIALLARAARNIVPSKQSVVMVVDGGKVVGISNSDAGDSEWTPYCPEHLNGLISEGSPLRTAPGAKCEKCPISTMRVDAYLGVPIATAKERYGWLCLMSELSGKGYTIEDERIMLTIAAQSAFAYENLLLYEQVKREAELLDHNVNLLRATIEASSDGILVIDQDLRFVTFNQPFVEIWRVPEDILRSGDGLRSLQHAYSQLRDPDAFRMARDKAAAEQEISGIYEMRDGRSIECHAAPRRFEGKVIGRVWSFRDVTARIRAKEALRQSEEKYRSLVQNIPDVIWTADADGNFSFVTSNVDALYGYTAEEVRANHDAHWLSRVHPEDRDGVVAAYADLFRGRKAFDCEYRLQKKDGAWIWVHGWSLTTYEREDVMYADGVLHDITARKKAEAELRRVARERELLLESTGEGVYAMDLKGRCTMANRNAAMQLGRTISELIGSHMHTLIHHHKADGSPYPAEECAIYRAFRDGEVTRVTTEVYWRKDGSSFPVEYIASPIVDYGEIRGAVVTFADVTESRRLERRMEQVNRIDSLGRMAATIAHEFNNVLMGIQPFAEVIRRRSSEDAKLQQSASQILTSVARGKTITQDILRMAKSAEPAMQSIDVAEWLEQLGGEIRALVGSKVTVNLQPPPKGNLFVHCDPSQMQQVVTNLAANARDAMSAGGTLTITAQRREKNVQLVVTDTGCGIPAETLPYVFEPLFTTKHSGTGLGLAVAQQIVVRNGGSISVESTVGEGTCFRIELMEGSPAMGGVAEEAKSMSPEPAIRRVVIVEDDSAVSSGLSAVLESEDVAVRVVASGGEAFDAVAEFHPDVVLIDISLPDMTGNAVYERIAAQWPDLAVIFSTGHAEESGLSQPESRHVGFLRKPYSTEMLLNKLREVL